MWSRCNGTRVSDGNEILGSITADEIFAGTWVKRRYSSSDPVSVAPYTPLAWKGFVQQPVFRVYFILINYVHLIMFICIFICLCFVGVIIKLSERVN